MEQRQKQTQLELIHGRRVLERSIRIPPSKWFGQTESAVPAALTMAIVTATTSDG